MTQPDWNDITGLIRVAEDGETITLTSDSKITGGVTADLKRGVTIVRNGFHLWVDPSVKIGIVGWKTAE